MKKICPVAVLFLIFASCAGSSKSTSDENVQSLKIDWTHIKDTVDYSSMVEDSILMFPLETTDDCLIGEVSKLIFQNNLIYIADNISKSLFVFDISGKLKTKVHAVGNGPGEYVNISYFTVHGTDMVLFDHYIGKFFIYDSSGNFIRDKVIGDIWTDGIFCLEDQLYLLNSSKTELGCYKLFAMNLKDDSTIEKYIPFDEPTINQGFGKNSYAHSKDEALLCFFPYDELYKVQGDNVSLAYKIDFGDKQLPKQYIEGDGSLALKTAIRDNYVTGINRVRLSEKYIFLQYNDTENNYITIYNKETGEMQTTKSLHNSLLGNLPLQLNGEKFTIQDEKIIQCYDADYWHLFNSSKYIESSDTSFYTEELRQRFLKLAQNDGSESNPVILIQKLKKCNY